jgi:hypothetical protein
MSYIHIIQSSPLHLDGKREGNGPGGNLLLEAVDLVDIAASNLGLEVLELVGFLGKLALDLLRELDDGVDVARDALEVLLAETTRCHGRRADADAHGCERGLVTRGGVLVAGDVDLLEDGLDARAVELDGLEVDEHHMVVSAASDERIAELGEGNLESLRVGDNLFLVGLEVVGLGLLEGHGEGGDGVVVGASLVAGEDGEVDGALEVVEGLLAGLCVRLAHSLAEEDHGTARATERLVGGGGDDVAVGEGRLVHAGGDETGDVGHVHEEIGTDLVGDLAHAGVVDLAAVGRGSGDEYLGAVHEGILLELVVVDEASLEVHPVGKSLKVGGDSRDPARGQHGTRTSLSVRAAYFLCGV